MKRSTIAAIVAGSLAVVSIIGLVVLLQGQGKQSKATKPKARKPAPKQVAEDVTIEDVDDDEEEEEEEEEDDEEEGEEEDEVVDVATAADNKEEQKKAEEAALKEEYDSVINTARKLLNGNAYARAAEKFTEALELAPRIPSAAKDIQTLYNNRSAMYEKAGEYEKSLNDITVILALDALHLKARGRRGRIYEAQGKKKEALDDFVVCMLIERAKGENPSSGEKVDELCKAVAAQEAAGLLKNLHNSTGKSLPTKAYCRNFFEAFPSLHRWREQYSKADRDELVAKLKAAVDADPSSTESLRHTLELAHHDVARGLFARCFETVNSFPIEGATADTQDRAVLLSQLWTLKGAELQLKSGIFSARQLYNTALALDPQNLEASLKLASIHLELGETAEAEAVYARLLASTPVVAEGEDAAAIEKYQNCWTLLHRANLWITRDSNGKFRPQAIDLAMADIDSVMNATVDAAEPEMKAARLVGLLKTVSFLSQIKSQIGLMPTQEDQDRISESVKIMKEIAPDHESVRLLEADIISVEGDWDKAMELIDEVIKTADPGDAVPTVIKANILTQKAMGVLQYGTQAGVIQAQGIFKEVEDLYREAMKIEPAGLEGVAQLAQLKSMLGDMDAALELSVDALTKARTRDEIQELSQLVVLTRAQSIALKEHIAANVSM